MTTANQLTPTACGTAACEARPMRSVLEPAADVVEKPDALHLVLDLPGVDQKGLEVSIEDHVLRIRGSVAETDTADARPAHREFEACDYERSFRLTPDLDESRIAASLKNGVLRLVLPKREEAKPRKISVAIE